MPSSPSVVSPVPIRPGMGVRELVEETFQAANAARLREACRMFTDEMLAGDVVVGISLTGALTPAGLGISALIPLIEAGFVDWIVSTGANLYHDTHFGIGLELHRGSPMLDDVELREEGVVRIYDILFDYDVLLKTDSFFREVLAAPEFQRRMSTAEMHYRVGRYVAERERVLGLERRSLVSTAHRYAVPVYTSSPGDSSIGMNVAALALQGKELNVDLAADVNETAAIVHAAGRNAAIILGGGSPKNFLLQTEAHLRLLHGDAARGFEQVLQVTDARRDGGGFSGSPAPEAIRSQGGIGRARTLTCALDTTIALPFLAAYALESRPPREPRRLYERREAMLDELRRG